MGLNAKKVPMNGSNKDIAKQEAVEAGSYPARIVQILDFGLQPQRAWQGEEKPPVQEIHIVYELLDEYCLDEEGEEIEDKPRWISETIPLHNLEADLAKSTKRYKALDPEITFDGDFTQLVDIPCTVTITTNAGKGKNVGKTYNNVASIAPMRPKEAKKAAALVNESKIFIIDDADVDGFNSLPEWQQDKIKSNLEFKGSDLANALGGKSEEPKKKPASKKVEVEEAEEDEEW